MSKQAVIVVDLQNEYLPTGKLPLVNIEAALDNAAKVIEYARTHSIPVIHIRHEFLDPNASFFVKNTTGVEIIDTVSPLEDECVITKNYPNSFLQTELDQKLKAEGVDQLTIIGAMSHMCIDATTRAASDLGYQCTVVEDACTTMDLEFNGRVVEAAQVHAALMAALAFAYASITSTTDYLNS
ncbi:MULTISPECIES: cysteine hydrolase family protein [Acinetobacter]|uniref:cysteine hydrolase family protein n=1 Tax=Acinetobacter TaxID=469 RepID=UPI002448C630|nr:cysteine hydrolase family protein [Acinetobacter baumannii]MDH2662486.1 cysteine hydrolase family protein [Acinetobacter baumannii]